MAEEKTTNAIHGSDDFESVVLHAKEPVLVGLTPKARIAEALDTAVPAA